MSDLIIIKVPTINEFVEVDVIEVLISPGDTVAIESPLITLESEKASVDIPSPVSGQIVDVLVQIGDRVYFVCDSAHLERAMASFGHEEDEARSAESASPLAPA